MQRRQRRQDDAQRDEWPKGDRVKIHLNHVHTCARISFQHISKLEDLHFTAYKHALRLFPVCVYV